jgi:hypothetical protein
LSDLFLPIFSATLKKSLQNDVELDLHLLLQFFRKLIDVHGMVDVALMRDLGVLSPVSSTLLHMLLEENLIFRLAFPSRVAKKYVDAEDCSKTTH